MLYTIQQIKRGFMNMLYMSFVEGSRTLPDAVDTNDINNVKINADTIKQWILSNDTQGDGYIFAGELINGDKVKFENLLSTLGLNEFNIRENGANIEKVISKINEFLGAKHDVIGTTKIQTQTMASEGLNLNFNSIAKQSGEPITLETISDISALSSSNESIDAPIVEKINFRDTATLQRFLNENGFNAGVIDGKFGKNTRAAVIAFQKEYGLKVDGIVGRNTIAQMNKIAGISPTFVKMKDRMRGEQGIYNEKGTNVEKSNKLVSENTENFSGAREKIAKLVDMDQDGIDSDVKHYLRESDLMNLLKGESEINNFLKNLGYADGINALDSIDKKDYQKRYNKVLANFDRIPKQVHLVVTPNSPVKYDDLGFFSASGKRPDEYRNHTNWNSRTKGNGDIIEHSGNIDFVDQAMQERLRGIKDNIFQVLDADALKSPLTPGMSKLRVSIFETQNNRRSYIAVWEEMKEVFSNMKAYVDQKGKTQEYNQLMRDLNTVEMGDAMKIILQSVGENLMKKSYLKYDSTKNEYSTGKGNIDKISGTRDRKELFKKYFAPIGLTDEKNEYHNRYGNVEKYSQGIASPNALGFTLVSAGNGKYGVNPEFGAIEVAMPNGNEAVFKNERPQFGNLLDSLDNALVQKFIDYINRLEGIHKVSDRVSLKAYLESGRGKVKAEQFYAKDPRCLNDKTYFEFSYTDSTTGGVAYFSPERISKSGNDRGGNDSGGGGESSNPGGSGSKGTESSNPGGSGSKGNESSGASKSKSKDTDSGNSTKSSGKFG